jgi:hypothetical protein
MDKEKKKINRHAYLKYADVNADGLSNQWSLRYILKTLTISSHIFNLHQTIRVENMEG